MPGLGPLHKAQRRLPTAVLPEISLAYVVGLRITMGAERGPMGPAAWPNGPGPEPGPADACSGSKAADGNKYPETKQYVSQHCLIKATV